MTEEIDHIIHPNGVQEWRKNNKRHRLDDPAIIFPNGVQEWFQNGQRHRIDGPAYIWADGRQTWYVNHINVTDRVKKLIDNCSINPDYTLWTDAEKFLVQLTIR